jgi:hypothetical protein
VNSSIDLAEKHAEKPGLWLPRLIDCCPSPVEVSTSLADVLLSPQDITARLHSKLAYQGAKWTAAQLLPAMI